MSEIGELALQKHKELKGKLSICGKETVTPENLSIYYTPGVGAVASYIANHPEEKANYTIINNMVAIVSDGSAVLGLGNIGPEAALPIMEGKAMLFKQFAGVDAFPIVLNTQNSEAVVQSILAIAPSFGGINLEDIAAPHCYEIEQRLQEKLTIPVMHDDQHATAVVVLAGLINACKVTNRELTKAKIVILGAGAAASGTTNLLLDFGVQDLILVDRKGILYPGRDGMDQNKANLADRTNPRQLTGDLAAALTGADCLIGLSGANLVTPAHLKLMAPHPIVFALSNPDPEIIPADAIAAGAAVVATGRSDFPNQINNVLVFPGFFRGALDAKISRITKAMKLGAAIGLAKLVETPNAQNIIPSVFDDRVVKVVSEAVANAKLEGLN